MVCVSGDWVMLVGHTAYLTAISVISCQVLWHWHVNQGRLLTKLDWAYWGHVGEIMIQWSNDPMIQWSNAIQLNGTAWLDRWKWGMDWIAFVSFFWPLGPTDKSLIWGGKRWTSTWKVNASFGNSVVVDVSHVELLFTFRKTHKKVNQLYTSLHGEI